MKMRLLVLYIVIMQSCNTTTPELKNLSGYWEISEVIFKDGKKRNYNVNTTVDFIEMNNDSIGFRKKIKPRLDGSFETSDDQENITIRSKADGLWIEYTTPLASWTEKIVFLNADRLELLNQNSIRYIYKRFTPFNLE